MFCSVCIFNKPTFAYFFTILILFQSCRSDIKTEDHNVISVRISREPDLLNPVLSETSVSATIQNLLFLPVMDFDPYTQESKAVLAISKGEVLINGNIIGYKLKIRPEAVWDDGSSITARDIVFTLKATLNPFVESGAKRSVIESIDSIEITDNPQEFIFWTDDNYFLDEQSFTNNFILQENLYDPSAILNNIPWSSLKSLSLKDSASTYGRMASQFANEFSNPTLSREGASGAGPYKIDQWITNQILRLKRKPNWWGSKYKDSAVNFRAYPNEIIFRIIPEESNAVIALKDGALDIVPELSPAMFKNMQEDTALVHKISFLQGPPNRYVYFALNNKSELLNDVNTRKALAHLLDLDQLKNSLFQGFAERINAPFQPSKTYYNKQLSDIRFDIDAAKADLASAGWFDTNHNGTVDKKILNKTKELKLRLYTTPGGLGQKVALHMQEKAIQAGVSIEVIPKPLPIMLQDIHAHNFEIAALAEVQYPGPDDPYSTWHSKSYTDDGQNITGFMNHESDSLIELIRYSEPGKNRNQYYQSLQQIIYENQPVIFLFAPQNLLAVSKKWKAKSASVRPGYFVNDFEQN